jgi:MoaC family
MIRPILLEWASKRLMRQSIGTGICYTCIRVLSPSRGGHYLQHLRNFGTNNDNHYHHRRQQQQRRNSSSGSDHHAFFQQQLEELNAERKTLFGTSDEDNTSSSLENNSLTDFGNKIVLGQQQLDDDDNDDEKEDSTTLLPAGDFEVDLEELHAERQALFQFSSQEIDAWQSHQQHYKNNKDSRLPAELLHEVAQARVAAAAATDKAAIYDGLANDPLSTTTTTTSATQNLQLQHHEFFTHVSHDGQSIHMVDVGHKQVTTRTATAQSKVILPPEVMIAFRLLSPSSETPGAISETEAVDEEGHATEMVGLKGPIFATAKLAGIMAAK